MPSLLKFYKNKKDVYKLFFSNTDSTGFILRTLILCLNVRTNKTESNITFYKDN